MFVATLSLTNKIKLLVTYHLRSFSNGKLLYFEQLIFITRVCNRLQGKISKSWSLFCLFVLFFWLYLSAIFVLFSSSSISGVALKLFVLDDCIVKSMFELEKKRLMKTFHLYNSIIYNSWNWNIEWLLTSLKNYWSGDVIFTVALAEIKIVTFAVKFNSFLSRLSRTTNGGSSNWHDEKIIGFLILVNLNN